MNKPTITTGHAGWSPDYKSDRPLRLIPHATICCQTCGKPKPEDACECRGSLKTMLEVGPKLVEALERIRAKAKSPDLYMNDLPEAMDEIAEMAEQAIALAQP